MPQAAQHTAAAAKTHMTYKGYRVSRKGFEVIEYATSSGAAALAVMKRYHFPGVSAKPVTVQ